MMPLHQGGTKCFALRTAFIVWQIPLFKKIKSLWKYTIIHSATSLTCFQTWYRHTCKNNSPNTVEALIFIAIIHLSMGCRQICMYRSSRSHYNNALNAWMSQWQMNRRADWMQPFNTIITSYSNDIATIQTNSMRGARKQKMIKCVQIKWKLNTRSIYLWLRVGNSVGSTHVCHSEIISVSTTDGCQSIAYAHTHFYFLFRSRMQSNEQRKVHEPAYIYIPCICIESKANAQQNRPKRRMSNEK